MPTRVPPVRDIDPNRCNDAIGDLAERVKKLEEWQSLQSSRTHEVRLKELEEWKSGHDKTQRYKTEAKSGSRHRRGSKQRLGEPKQREMS